MAERRLMTKSKVKDAKSKVEAKQKADTEELFAPNLLKKYTEKTVKKMTNAETQALIEFVSVGEGVVKEQAKKIAAAKKLVMAHAKSRKWKTMASNGAIAKISPGTTTKVPVKKFAVLLHKLKKTKMLYDFLTVKITDAKKYLGEDVLAEIWEQDTDDYASLSITKMKK